ncbi:neuropeptide FF receptor 2-like [Saccoglossus kowalevskii]|uniref:Neuropeptide FF receptor 2-like n=1 Tax=Saccoglossus kowalevskii TaxID=10224 RepID=A0ABM0GR89_SACKO|nr:PREDICTED: neuropeptide FF receptor 2-like [Saccoglossus kowalevskii]
MDFVRNYSNETREIQPYLKNGPLITSIYICAYVFIFLMCLIGNSLVCLVVARNPRMHTVTNFFIVNLAVADILVAIFCMPITLVGNILEGWPFGVIMCKLTPVIQGLSVAASIFTLTIIAIDRHNNIVNPLRPRMEISTACVHVVVIWILSIAIMVPQGIVLDLIVWPLSSQTWIYVCTETKWPNVAHRKAYTAISFAFVYLIPLLLISVAYIRIVRKVWRRHAPGVTQETQSGAHASISKQKIKVLKMILVVVILFGVSMLPIHICMLLIDFGNMSNRKVQTIVLYVIPFAHWLAFFNSCVNPIVYGYYNNNFRRGFRSAMNPRKFCSFGSVREPGSFVGESEHLNPCRHRRSTRSTRVRANSHPIENNSS